MRKNEEIRFGNLLGGVYKKLHISENVVQHRVKDAWDRLFGATFASQLRKFEYSNRTMTLYITSDVLRHELFMNRSKIKDRMNEELRDNLIDQVILK